MIRSLQRAEGEADCFRQERRSCHRQECRWRIYCQDGRGHGSEFSSHPVDPERQAGIAPLSEAGAGKRTLRR